MSLKTFLKRCLMEYFIITTCVTAAIGILGLSLDPTAKVGYEGFFSPLIFGLVSLVPSVATYSRKELSFRQTLVRKLLHFALLQATLIAFGHWAGILRGFPRYGLFCACGFYCLSCRQFDKLASGQQGGQRNQ